MFPALCGRYSADLVGSCTTSPCRGRCRHGISPSYNVCPTDPVPVIIPNFDGRQLVVMRWGLVPGWWSKPLKELRLATFNARAETVQEKPLFREAFKRSRCLSDWFRLPRRDVSYGSKSDIAAFVRHVCFYLNDQTSVAWDRTSATGQQPATQKARQGRAAVKPV